jgi:hypothetical protein
MATDTKTVGYVVAAAIAGVVIAYVATRAVEFWDFGYEECKGQQCSVVLEATAECQDKKAKPHKIKVTTKNADIYWTAPTGYQFCDVDAPRFKDSGDNIYADQFTNRCKTNSTSGACPSPEPACSTYYHWTSVGDKVKKIEYEVPVTKTGTNLKCTIDPWVKNG